MPEAVPKLVNVERIDDLSEPISPMELQRFISEARSVISTSGVKAELSRAWQVLGSIAKRQKKLEQSLHHYRQAAMHDPGDWVNLNNEGAALEELGELEKALVLYDKAARLSDGNLIPFSNQASTLNKLDRRAEALVVLGKVLASVNDFPVWGMFMLAQTCNEMGLDFEAVEVLARLFARKLDRKLGAVAAARFIMEAPDKERETLLSMLTPGLARALAGQVRMLPALELFGPYIVQPEQPAVEGAEGETELDVFEAMRASRQRATAAVLAEYEDEARG